MLGGFILSDRRSDYVFHEPGGSNLPGSPDANPYVFYPPDEVRRLLKTEENPDELVKLKSALKQWERIYVYPGYPYRLAKVLRLVAAGLQRLSERTPVPQNMTYYNDGQVPEGFEEIMDSMRGLYDNQDNIKFDYNRQGERPTVDIDTGKGDFSAPSEPPMGDSVKERGDGPDPEGMEIPEPATGGDPGSMFQGI